MDIKKYNTILAKVKKWAKGKADADYEFFLVPTIKGLENYVTDVFQESDEIGKLVTIHDYLNVMNWWNFHKYLDLKFNSADSENSPKNLFEAMYSRILMNALGYTKPQNIGPVNEGNLGCCICDAIFLSDPLVENLIIGYAQNLGKKPPQLNPQSVIQFAHALYYHESGKSAELSKLFKTPLAVPYADLLDKIPSETVDFENAVNAACDFHLERSKSGMMYEFSYEETMLVPSEILATLKIRKSSGFELPEIIHPLVSPYMELIGKQRALLTSDLYRKVRRKIEKEYFKLE